MADKLDVEKAKGFLVVVFTFVTTLFANMKSIQLAPVDTFICLRSTTPLILAVLDYVFLGRDLPSAKSFGSLIGIAMGVLLYVNIDSNFSVQAYLWIVVWYVVSIFEIIYVKHLVSLDRDDDVGANVLPKHFVRAVFVDDVHFVRRKAGFREHGVDVWSCFFYFVELRRWIRDVLFVVSFEGYD